MWIDLDTKKVVTLQSEIRDLRPNWSAPLILTDEMIADVGFAPVELNPPEYAPDSQRVESLGPELVDGVWKQQYQIVDLTEDEITALRKAQVPTSVTRRQARQALLLAGLLVKVQPAIDAIPDPLQRGMAQIEWDDATDFDRNRPLLLQVAVAIGLDDAGLDDIFIRAATL